MLRDLYVDCDEWSDYVAITGAIIIGILLGLTLVCIIGGGIFALCIQFGVGGAIFSILFLFWLYCWWRLWQKM